MTLYNHPELYKALSNIKDTKDCRVFIHKAAYEYLYLNRLDESLKNITKAIQLFEDPKIAVTIDVNNLNVEILKKLSDIETRASSDYIIQMYQLAAEIYAELDNYEKSLEMYKKFYYFVNNVPVSKELQDKSEAVVYSFRQYNTYALEDLINDQITCVHPSKMNDPFDSIASYISNPDILKELCAKEKHIKSQSDCFKHFTIRSFFANRKTYGSNDNILFKKLMWFHYADSHKGFCVKYRINNKVFKQFDDSSETFTRLVPVDYTNRKISIYEKLNTDNSFAMKNSVWKKESEVRLVHFSRDCDADHTSIQLDDNIILEEVILGFKCSKDARKTIAKIVNGKCRLSEIYNDNGKNIYSLKKRDYSSK